MCRWVRTSSGAMRSASVSAPMARGAVACLGVGACHVDEIPRPALAQVRRYLREGDGGGLLQRLLSVADLDGDRHAVDPDVGRAESGAQLGAVLVQPLTLDGGCVERSRGFTPVASAGGGCGGAEQCRAAQAQGGRMIRYGRLYGQGAPARRHPG